MTFQDTARRKMGLQALYPLRPGFTHVLEVRIWPPPMIRSNIDLPSILPADGKPIITVV